MLETGLNAKSTEHEQEHENVVYAQGFFDEITGEELERRNWPVMAKNPEVESKGKPHPGDAPCGRLTERHGVRAAIEDAQIPAQAWRANASVESNPECRRAHLAHRLFGSIERVQIGKLDAGGFSRANGNAQVPAQMEVASQRGRIEGRNPIFAGSKAG